MGAVGGISGTRDWRRVLSEGRRTRRDGLSIAALAVDPGAGSRLGIRVRASGPARAVTRNLVRRRLRHAFLATGPRSGWMIAVTAQPEAGEKTFQELTELLEDGLAEVVSE